MTGDSEVGRGGVGWLGTGAEEGESDLGLWLRAEEEDAGTEAALERATGAA